MRNLLNERVCLSMRVRVRFGVRVRVRVRVRVGVRVRVTERAALPLHKVRSFRGWVIDSFCSQHSHIDVASKLICRNAKLMLRGGQHFASRTFLHVFRPWS